MRDVMTDLETTGTDPSHAAIIQIAAVRFDYDTGQIGDAFCASLHVPPTRFWDESTRAWWMKQGETYDRIVSQAVDPEYVFKAFRDWCIAGATLQSQRLWAKPISFEWPFLQSYARQYNVELPFHYRNAVDLNSFTRGLSRQISDEPFGYDLPMEGDAHNALDDVFHQIKIALLARHTFQ